MSKVQGKQPQNAPLIDLTKPRGSTAFQPGKGAKKLVIKNLRTVSRTNSLEQFYQKIWEDLESALQSIFARQQPRQPFDTLYKNIESLCQYLRKTREEKKLSDFLWKRCEDYLNEDMAKSIKAGAGASSIDLLRSAHKHWVIWQHQLATIRSIFSFLDRTFLLNSKELPMINDMGITLYRRMVFLTSKMGSSVLAGITDLIDHDRRGNSAFDASLLRESISMVHILNIYGKSFEPRLLETSREYYEEFAEIQSASSLKSYIHACKRLLASEDYRCNAFNFDSLSKRQLMDSAHAILIEGYSEKLLDSGGVSRLLDDNAVESMQALYQLLRLSAMQKNLRGPWEEYIRKAGAVIVNDTGRGDEMIVRLLEFRRALDIMVRDAFNQDEEFTYGLREAFGNFINDKKILSAWKTGTSKVGEMIAKYIDMLLRGGLKTIPQSLLSDNKDRRAAEQSGQASTGDEDAELDRQLDQALELFRFIEGKDVFEAFYKQDLARRLLMNRSASADAERSMLTKLKSECGSSFTHNLEQMFKDKELARDELSAYKSYRENTGRDKAPLDLNVDILSAAAWPTYPDVRLNLPGDVATQIEQFEKFYTSKHTGRRLTWKHALAHCTVKARFNKGPKELLVSAFQAVVLELFNQVEGRDDEFLTYPQIAEASGLTGKDLDRTLQSLACGKTRVLSKTPKGKDVKETDTFSVNKAFTDPKYRVKINQIQLKETKEENEATHQKVAVDRQFETQAAIVRIMKSRKTMTHANLVAEVINQTKSRGAVDTGEIKKNIEKLIEKDYLERDGNSYEYLA
ncbi:Cullin [Truncatella angustata]|uniref:Cullin n=1 Tax=Truncatella angustata TaxID=152316 RepID=A0A9P8ZYV6_9PEZI|nr:Cullin [Truncatella angustata]KAH6654411.1 Cullin [Truncatella angustata]